jgi:hypothetical protein
MTSVLQFSVRTTTSESFETVLRLVEGALNIKFREDEFEGSPAYTSNLLGMKVGLFMWANDYVLESRIEDSRFLDSAKRGRLKAVGISEVVADMLTILGPFSWRVATGEDIKQDERFAAKVDRELNQDSGAPPWA